jgi:AraC family transcriptional regulator
METAYAPCAVLPKHQHECAYLCLVLQGAYSEVYGGRTRVCKPSTLIFHSPGEVHSDHFHKTGGRCFNIQVNSYWLGRVRAHSMVLDSKAEFRGGVVVNLAMKLYNEFRLLDESAPLAIEGLMLEILAEASRHAELTAGRNTPRRIERAREFLHDHFHESISLEHVAKSVEAHPVYLAREFRRYHRCTVGEYVRRLRVEFACSKLSTSDEPLAKIALTAGFSDQSHFSRVIRNHTGTSPAKYRKIHRAR